MRTIGLLGGMSFESTITYYRLLNEMMNKKLGGLHSAKIVMYSVDFFEIEQCQKRGDWDKAASILNSAAKHLANSGSDLILLCTNTMHKVIDQISDNITIPFLHIAQATGEAILEANITKVALLGTRYTMEETFYRKKLEDMGISVLIPCEEDRSVVHDVIFTELCQGIISKESKESYLKIIDKLAQEGAQGVILGCTEIGLLVEAKDCSLPLFDTTVLHAQKAVSICC